MLYICICTLTWHTIWFDLYKAVYCKLIKPMDYRQARHWHLVNTCTYIVIIQRHTMYIQKIYCFQSQHFPRFTTNLDRTLNVHGDHDHVIHNQSCPSCVCFREIPSFRCWGLLTWLSTASSVLSAQSAYH